MYIPPAHEAKCQIKGIIPKPAILSAEILQFKSTACPNLSVDGNKPIEQLIPHSHGSELM